MALDLKVLMQKITAKRAAPVGIDVGNHSVKIVKLSKTKGGGYTLDFCGQVIAKPSDKDFNAKVSDYLKSSKISGFAAAAAFDDSKLKIRKIEIAKMPEADLLEAIRWKMRDLVEGNIEDYIVRYSVLDETGTGDTKKLVLVGLLAPKPAIKSVTEQMTKIGMQPIVVEPTAISLSYCVDRVNQEKEKWVGAIDIGSSKSLMVINGRGKFHFSRPLVNIALPDFNVLDPTFNQRLAGEVQHTIDNFAITFKVEHLDKLYLAGGGASMPGLADYLSKNLAVPTEILNPFDAIYPGFSEGQKLPEYPSSYAQAIALSMS